MGLPLIRPEPLEPAPVPAPARLALVEALDPQVEAIAMLRSNRDRRLADLLSRRAEGPLAEMRLRSAERLMGWLLASAWVGMWIRILAGG